MGWALMRRVWIAGATGLSLATPTLGLAQRFETLNGPPVQMRPYVSEPGAPQVTMTTGTSAFSRLDSDPSNGGAGTGTSGSAAGGLTTGISGSSDSLNTMLGTSWGAQAAANAQSLGVNASALAATCVVESGCGVNVGSGSGAQGVFQMYSAAYTDGLNTALAANPSLASQIVPGLAGMKDSTTEAIAASGYLMQATQALQAGGISNPTVLDARAYYQFGPTSGLQLAQASGDQSLAAAMPNVSAATLQANGLSTTETVGQWRASVASKIGNAASQTVLN